MPKLTATQRLYIYLMLELHPAMSSDLKLVQYAMVLYRCDLEALLYAILLENIDSFGHFMHLCELCVSFKLSRTIHRNSRVGVEQNEVL